MSENSEINFGVAEDKQITGALEKAKTIIPGVYYATDGFVNEPFKLGDSASNSVSKGEYTYNRVSQKPEKLRRMYRSNWLARRIIDLASQDMTRDGVIFKGIDSDDDVNLQAAWTRHNVSQDLEKLAINGRLFGGAIALIDIQGQQRDTVLNIDRVGKGQYNGLKIFDRWSIHTVSLTYDPLTGFPTMYQITFDPSEQFDLTTTLDDGRDVGIMEIHPSRVIRLDGDYLDSTSFEENSRWGASVLESPAQVIDYYNTSSAVLASMTTKSARTILKLPNLEAILNQGDEGQTTQNLFSHISKMTQESGVEGVTATSENGDVFVLEYNMEGIVKALAQQENQIAGAYGYTVAKLFGEQSSGLSNTGESDLSMYYDQISVWQNKMDLFSLCQVLYKSTFGKKVPTEFNYDYAPLWQMDESQKADIAFKTTQSIGEAVDKGIITDKIAMQELQKTSETHGLFTTITGEDIDNAEDEVPPPSTPFINPAMIGGDNIDSDNSNGDSPVDRVQNPTAEQAQPDEIIEDA